jgi:methyl-accepting chemotaxis protein
MHAESKDADTQSTAVSGGASASSNTLGIWARQIENAREQTEAAILQLTGLFGDMVGKLDQSIETSQRASDGNSGHAQEDREQALSKLTQVISDLRDAQKNRDLLNAEIKEMVAQTDELSRMADEVKTIALQTNMLSLNAAIAAAHAGSSGKAFAVVADEVRHLSTASRDTGQKINTRISTINEALKAIAARNAAVSSNDREVIARSEQSIEGVLQRQSERVEQFVADATASREQNSAIKRDIEDALVHFQFQDRVSQILAQLAAAMTSADSLASDLASQQVNTGANRYTTDEQRRIHAGLDAQAVAPQEVTFF